MPTFMAYIAVKKPVRLETSCWYCKYRYRASF